MKHDLSSQQTKKGGGDEGGAYQKTKLKKGGGGFGVKGIPRTKEVSSFEGASRWKLKKNLKTWRGRGGDGVSPYVGPQRQKGNSKGR